MTLATSRCAVRQKPRDVDLEKCSGCGECVAACPVAVPQEFDQLLSQRRAIHRLFPQAVPGAFAIDKQGVAPCRAACPAGVNVPGALALIGAGKFDEALDLIRRDQPFPGVCGRVCHQPVRQACSRAEAEGSLGLALKRFVADSERKQLYGAGTGQREHTTPLRAGAPPRGRAG